VHIFTYVVYIGMCRCAVATPYIGFTMIDLHVIFIRVGCAIAHQKYK